MVKRMSLLGALSLIAVVLTGCASIIGGVERSYAGLPETLTPAEQAQVPAEEPSIWWIEEGSRAALVTPGSSTCHYEVARIQTVSESEIAIRLDRTGGEVCTADIAPRTHELTMPRNSERPLTVTLIFPDEDSATELTLP